MNIFAVHANPFIAASMLCNEHCNKMVLESAQMLANCFTLEQLQDAPFTKTGNPRKHSYYNHPSSKWVRESKVNMRWLIDHAIELERQRILRGFNPHFSYSFILWCKDNMHRSVVPDGKMTKLSIAINEEQNCRKLPYFDSLSTVDKYRHYYVLDKSFATWKNSQQPEWYQVMQKQLTK